MFVEHHSEGKGEIFHGLMTDVVSKLGLFFQCSFKYCTKIMTQKLHCVHGYPVKNKHGIIHFECQCVCFIAVLLSDRLLLIPCSGVKS